jgi:hypothetical protein
MTLKKPLLIASLAATVAMAAVSTKAEAGDPVLGALIGGGIGAAIGHDVNRHGGAAVGGLLGAVVGSSIASSSGYYDRGYYDRGYYDSGYYGSRYYAPAPVYYGAPVYSAPVYPSYGVTYVYRDGGRYRDHGYRDHRRDWRHDRHDGRSWR